MEELDIKEIIYEIWKNKIMILVIMLLGVALGLLYHSFLVKPLYQSTTTLVLSKPATAEGSQTGTSGTITSNDIALNQKLVSTYSEIMKSRTVAREVINKLGLKVSEESLMNDITVQSKKDTELLEIAVSYTNAAKAAEIANTLAEVFTNKVKEVYNIENVSIIDQAEVATAPYNISLTKTMLLFLIASFIIGCLVVFVKMYFSNTIKSQEELEKLLGLPVLAVIPDLKE